MTERLAGVLEKMPKRGRWVFTAPTTTRYPQPDRQISERRSLLALKRVLKQLKLPGHQHTFRHTYISQALAAGVPEAVVQSWVGHVDRNVIRLYTHISDEVSQGYVSRFSAASRTEESQSNKPTDGNEDVSYSFQHTQENYDHGHVATKKPSPSYGDGFVDERRGRDSNPR